MFDKECIRTSVKGVEASYDGLHERRGGKAGQVTRGIDDGDLYSLFGRRDCHLGWMLWARHDGVLGVRDDLESIGGRNGHSRGRSSHHRNFHL